MKQGIHPVVLNALTAVSKFQAQNNLDLLETPPNGGVLFYVDKR